MQRRSLIAAEGPVYFPDDGGYVLVSDIPNNRMMKFSERDGSFTVFRRDANGANGNARDRQGRLVTGEHSVTRASAGRRTIASTWPVATPSTAVRGIARRHLN